MFIFKVIFKFVVLYWVRCLRDNLFGKGGKLLSEMLLGMGLLWGVLELVFEVCLEDGIFFWCVWNIGVGCWGVLCWCGVMGGYCELLFEFCNLCLVIDFCCYELVIFILKGLLILKLLLLGVVMGVLFEFIVFLDKG